MLDLNYLRENLEAVRAALQHRGMPANALEDFAKADAERRQVIADSDRLNAERNTASREIGELMKTGKLRTLKSAVGVRSLNLISSQKTTLIWEPHSAF